jgi:hypothetical protein
MTSRFNELYVFPRHRPEHRCKNINQMSVTILAHRAHAIAEWLLPMKHEMYELRDKKIQEMTEELLLPPGVLGATVLAAILILILLWENLRLT